MNWEKHKSYSRLGAAAVSVPWIVGVAGLSLAIAAVVGISQDNNKLAANAPLVSAQELSRSFRSIADQTFPGIVAIETRGQAMQASGGLDLEDFFRGDPNFERFFKQNPEMRPKAEKNPRRRIVPQGQGSGFVIDRNGTIMTNNHVVENAEEIIVRLHDGREYEAEKIGVDPRSDVAVIRIDAPDVTPIPLGDSDQMEVGDWVLAFGSPFGLELTVTQGIISAKGRGPGINDREDYLQTDAAINPGNSGGPLVNLSGEVIGINTAISSRSGGYDGVGFSIPINMAKWIGDQLIENGRVRRAYIGVVIQPVNNDLANQLGLNVNEGAIVSQIVPDSPSAKAGLETGDVILELNGKPVGGTRQLQGIVEQLAVGKSYPLLVYRDGRRKELKIKMAEMPDNMSMLVKEGGNESERKQSEDSLSVDGLGISVQQLSDELAEQLGYPDNVSGVVITEVEEGSVAELNGLQAGELIEKVGSTKITTLKMLETALEDADYEKGVLMLVRRGGLTRFIVVKER